MAHNKPTGVPVTRTALIARLRRKLRQGGVELHVSRPLASTVRNELGEAYLVDSVSNTVTASNVDIEALAREEGVLRAYEVFARDARA